MATVKGKTTEAPSLVFKLRSGGEVWISGIPAGGFAGLLHGGDSRATWGSDPRRSRFGELPQRERPRKTAAWKKLFPLIRQWLFQGDKVLIHCIAGRHRAAAAGTVTVACAGAQSSWLRTGPKTVRATASALAQGSGLGGVREVARPRPDRP